MYNTPRNRCLQAVVIAAATALLCVWLGSWQSWSSAVYDVSLGVGLFGYLVQTVVRVRQTGMDRRRVAMLLALGVACAIAIARLRIRYEVPISGHMTVLTTVLGLALLDGEPRRRARTWLFLPWAAVLLTRWTILDWGHHWQTIGALVAGAVLVALAWLVGVLTRKRPFRWLALVAGGYLLLCGIAGVFLGEGAIRPARLANDPGARERLAALGKLEDVEVTPGGARLRGWYLVPPNDCGRAVLALHGIADRRSAMVAHAELLARHGYRVLLADLRGHGDSEGDISTYGVIEAQDVVVWQRWLTERGARAVFGFGASLGAAVLLQAPRAGARFDGVVAEASYSSFADIAQDRIGAKAGALSWFARLLSRPIIASGVLYVRLRYDIDLAQASPAQAAAATDTPVLLIHGDADVETPPWHSMAIRDASPEHAELWIVPGAWHCGAWARAPQEFERRVIEWIEAHESR